MWVYAVVFCFLMAAFLRVGPPAIFAYKNLIMQKTEQKAERVQDLITRVIHPINALPSINFDKEKRKKGEKNKKESHIKGGMARLSRFLQKILPETGGDFLQNSS